MKTNPFENFFKNQKSPLELFLGFTHSSDPVSFAYLGAKEEFLAICEFLIEEMNKVGMLNSFKVVIRGTVKGKVENTFTLFNPVRNPEFEVYFKK